MKNKTTKMVSLLLSVIMGFSIFVVAPAEVSAQSLSYHQSGNYQYTVSEDGTAEITKYLGHEENVEIPSEINGSTITSIGKYAFGYCNSIVNVQIPSSITKIGNIAFNDCEKLENILVDKQNEYYCDINGILFSKDKTKLIQYAIGKEQTSYVIPNSVTNIIDEAFEWCNYLKSITIGNSVKKIGDNAFAYCLKLKAIKMSDSVTSIGDNAFYYCENLKNITIPAKVQVIGDDTFTYCYGLENIYVNIDNTFYSDINGVLLSKDKSRLIQYPIGNVRTSYNIPNSIKDVGNGAFNESKLENITIPDSVKDVGYATFLSCRFLQNITVDSQNKYLCDIDGVLFTKDKTGLIQYAIGKDKTSYHIPNGVIYIDDLSFSSSKLKYISIPYSVTEIFDRTFEYCEFTISGLKDSTAQIYAGNNDIPFVLKGDVNLDDTSDINDATLIQKYLAKKSTLSNKQIFVADTNEDETVDINDVTMIQKILAKKAQYK